MSTKRARRSRIRARSISQDRACDAPPALVAGAALEPTPPESRPNPSPLRRWLFRGILLAAPWSFFLALELGLRAMGYGVSLDFALRRDVQGEPRFLSNPRFTWLFFDPGLARLCPPFSLAVAKPRNACRVFVLGSSAAQGDPEPGFGLARMLEVLLRDQYPGVDFEVVNAATAAIDSHVVYAMAGACARLEPDVFVLYTGNNEVVGPYGAGTALTAIAPPLRLVRAGVALRSTRTGQLLSATVRRVSATLGRDPSPGSWRGMEMFVDRQVRLADPALARTYENYEQNLLDTCRLAHRARVPVVLSTLAVNLRNCAPFGSLHAAALSPESLGRWERLYRDGARLEGERRFADAVPRFREAASLDEGFAELEYRWARCEWSLGRYEEARRHYLRSLDLDTLRFRADSRINEIVRRVAEREALRGVQLVDAAERIAEQAPHGVPGDEVFLDHVHLSFAGNYLVSVALLEKMRAVLPDRVRERRSARPLLSEEECAQRLVFTELDRYMLAETVAQRVRQAPFTGQADHAEQVERYSRELATLRARGESGAVADAVQEYEQALAGERPSWTLRERYAMIERRVGNTEVAEREWRVLTSRFPQYPSFHLQLARTLRAGGKYAEAESSLREVLELLPDSSLVLDELAWVELQQGRASDAIGHARRAVALDPGDPSALHVLATSLCRRDSCTTEARAEALARLAKALALAPDSEVIRRDLARTEVGQAESLLSRGDQGGAVASLERAIQVKPDLIDAHEALGLLYRRLNEREKAIEQLSIVLKAEPTRAGAREALAALERR